MTPHDPGRRAALMSLLATSLLTAAGCSDDDDEEERPQPLPDAILQILAGPRYRSATWGLRVVDVTSGRVVHELNGPRPFLIGSVRKLFSVGLSLDALGADHVFRTPVHRRGSVGADGVLAGDLILVAAGDLAMGGRTNPDGSYAISDFDHNEADSLGGAELTAPDPLAGYQSLAAQVRAAGITRVSGDVIIDDRLFEPFDFRNEFSVTPIFVNDDVIDVAITPAAVSRPAGVAVRPQSAAFEVRADVEMVPAGSPFALTLDPRLPGCLGHLPCGGSVTGTLPAGFVPPLTGRYPLVRTFRITRPTDYARSVFIEALRAAGVRVDAATVAPNPAGALPAAPAVYPADTRVAELLSHPWRDQARHVLKVSYNIGADTALMHFGLTRGARTQAAALDAERALLAADFGIDPATLRFIDGSGGGDSSALQASITTLLDRMRSRPSFPAFLDALPRLGVDGSLGFVTDFAADPTLAGARGQVHAKTGTFVEGTADGALLRAQALAGYIDAKSGRRLAFALAVNDAGKIAGIDDIFPVFQDQGTISALLWKTL